MAEELKKIYPGVEYTLGNGDKVMVSPVPFGKLMVFGEAIAALFQKLAVMGVTAQAEGDWSGFDFGMVFTSAVEEVITLMGLVLDRDREWFDTISTDDGLALFNLIVKQNVNEETKKNILAIAQTIKSQFPSISST